MLIVIHRGVGVECAGQCGGMSWRAKCVGRCGEWPVDGNEKKRCNVIDDADAGKSCGVQALEAGIGHCQTVDTCRCPNLVPPGTKLCGCKLESSLIAATVLLLFCESATSAAC